MNYKKKFKIPNAKDHIDLRFYILKLISYWKLFSITILTALIVANFLNGYKQKKYTLSTIISIKEENNPLFSTGTNIAFNWGGASDEIESIKVILNSRSHNEKVVKKTSFFVSYLKEGEYRNEDIYGYTPFTVKLQTDKPQLLNKLLKIEIVGKNTFKLSFDFNSDEPDNLINYDTNIISKYSSSEPSFSKEFDIVEVIETPFLNFSLQKNNLFKIGKIYFISFQDFDDTVGAFKDISVKEITDAASLLSLSMSGPNKNRIVDYLNATVKILGEDKQEQKIQYAINTKKYIDELFAIEKDSLNKIEKEIGIYKERYNIFDLSLEGSQLYDEILELEKQKKELTEYNNYLKKLKIYILTHNQYVDGIPVPALIKIQDTKIAEGITILIQKSTLRLEL